MLTIGEVAEQTGIAASALRYYEREGLIPVADRQGGKRVYGEDILDRLTIIGVAKGAGFADRKYKRGFGSTSEYGCYDNSPRVPSADRVDRHRARSTP